MNIKTFALYGAWNTSKKLRMAIIKMSDDLDLLENMLGDIVKSKAKGYVPEEFSKNCSDAMSDHMYSMVGADGGRAIFYITEQVVELSDDQAADISEEVKKHNLKKDIENTLLCMHVDGSVEDWKYEYVNNCPMVIDTMCYMYSKYESCDTSYNATLDYTIEETLKRIHLSDDVLQFLWERFADVPVDDDGNLLNDFIGFDIGTNREEVWHWFDEYYSKGVAELMGQ